MGIKPLHPVEIAERERDERWERERLELIERLKKEREAFKDYLEEVEASHDWNQQELRCYTCGIRLDKYKFDKEYVEKFHKYAPIKCAS